MRRNFNGAQNALAHLDIRGGSIRRGQNHRQRNRMKKMVRNRSIRVADCCSTSHHDIHTLGIRLARILHTPRQSRRKRGALYR